MTKEFNLSERRRVFKEGEEVWTDEILLVEDVKKFIRLETKLINDLISEEISSGQFWNKRDKLAGDKLT